MTQLSAPTMLNPMLVNLRHQLRLHLDGIVPLIANQAGLGMVQARLLCHQISDATLIFLLKSYQDVAGEPVPRKVNHRIYQILNESVIDTTTLTRLPKTSPESLFGEKSQQVIKRIATVSNLYLINPSDNTPSDELDLVCVQHTIEYVATIVLHHIDVLVHDGGLDVKEQQTWFALQSLFLKNKINILVWASLAEYDLIPKKLSGYSDYRKKIGINGRSFDKGEYVLPNHAWLLQLAQTIKDKHQVPLLIGCMGNACLNFDDNIRPKRQKTWDMRIVAAAVLVLAVGVVSVPNMLKQKERATIVPVATKPANTKTQSLGYQDIAVVRVDDNESGVKGKKLPNKTDSKAQNDKKQNTKDNANAQKNSDKKSNKTDNKDKVVANKKTPPKADGKKIDNKKADNKKVDNKKADNKKLDAQKNNQKANSQKTNKKTETSAQSRVLSSRTATNAQTNKKDQKTQVKPNTQTNKKPSSAVASGQAKSVGNQTRVATSTTQNSKTTAKTATINTLAKPKAVVPTPPKSETVAATPATSSATATPPPPPTSDNAIGNHTPNKPLIMRSSKNNPNNYNQATNRPTSEPKNNPAGTTNNTSATDKNQPNESQ